MECQWIQPERHELKEVALRIQTEGPVTKEYGVELDVDRQMALLDWGSRTCSRSIPITNLRPSIGGQKYWRAHEPATKRHWGQI